jgi:NAD+ diphosphatase
MYTPEGFTPLHVLPPALPDTTIVFAYREAKLLVTGSEEHPQVPSIALITAAGLAGPHHFLGLLAATPCIAMTLPDDAPDPAGMRYAGLRSLFFRLPDPLLALAARAFQVIEWDRTHRYCGRCGTPTRNRSDERAKECPACGYIAYPRVSPAMMALITRGREMLLAKAQHSVTGMYSALAGFVEPGETIEDCVRREVREEVGLEVEGITYFASQSWAFPHSLMIAYTAEYAGGEIRLEDAEIADAQWFSVDAMPPIPPSVSIARKLIEATAARLREMR